MFVWRRNARCFQVGRLGRTKLPLEFINPASGPWDDAPLRAWRAWVQCQGLPGSSRHEALGKRVTHSSCVETSHESRMTIAQDPPSTSSLSNTLH